ncbi:serine--tRNA ligase, partial [Acinetobacter baumannii]
AEVEALKGELDRHYAVEAELGPKLKDILARLPNIPADEVPEGEDETGNREVAAWGQPADLPASRLNLVKDHVELGEALGMMDFEAAA